MDGEVSREPVKDVRTRAPRPRAIVNRRWKFLAEAGALLDASLDYETTLANVVRLAVPTIADYAAIALLEGDGSARWDYSAHRNPGKASLAERLRAHQPNLALFTHPLAEALRSGGAQPL